MQTIRYEARIDGGVEPGVTFTDFNELDSFKDIIESINWQYKLLSFGRGGYYEYEVIIDGTVKVLHIYLKKLTFGGRENRPYEKRAQFSAALDRTGFEASNNDSATALIIAIYKRAEFPDPIICAWDINDWGYNIGRAFNCFIDIKAIAEAYKEGFAQHKTSIGQIACCFKPEFFEFYLEYKDVLHKQMIDLETFIVDKAIPKTQLPENNIPKFDDLFQLIIYILKNEGGAVVVDVMEKIAADELKLSPTDRTIIHNLNEGYRTELGYQLAWARFYLKKAGLIESRKRGFWNLTDKGETINQINKEEIKKIATSKEANTAIERDFTEEILEVRLDPLNIDVELEVNNVENINNPFDPNLVDIKTRTMSLDLILKRLDRNNINLNTSFQRKAGLWDLTKQSRLIESILIKFPLPAFYFDGSDDDNWLVVDGLQRLSSLDNFVNKKTFNLQNLEFLSQFNGKRFNELPPGLQRRIEEFEITAYIISPATPKALKYIAFKRINTGGLILSAQEIRNALNEGTPSEFVKRLASIKSFKLATAFSISEDRMLDCEFVTRFLAFYLNPIDDYNSDLETFLDKTMEGLYKLDQSVLEDTAYRFGKAMLSALSIFKDDAFRRRTSIDDKRKPINKALFEVWSVCLAKLGDEERAILIQQKEAVLNRFIDLQNKDQQFNLSISTSTADKLKVRKRFAEIEKLIQSILN